MTKADRIRQAAAQAWLVTVMRDGVVPMLPRVPVVEAQIGPDCNMTEGASDAQGVA